MHQAKIIGYRKFDHFGLTHQDIVTKVHKWKGVFLSFATRGFSKKTK